MAVLRIAFTRLRLEEKLLKEAADRLGVPCELQNVTDAVIGGAPFCAPDDVVLARCVSHNQNEAVAELLETEGVTVVNASRVMKLCGNKLSTSAALERAGIAQVRRGCGRIPCGLQFRRRQALAGEPALQLAVGGIHRHRAVVVHGADEIVRALRQCDRAAPDGFKTICAGASVAVREREFRTVVAEVERGPRRAARHN